MATGQDAHRHDPPYDAKRRHNPNIGLFKIRNAIASIFGYAILATSLDEDLMYERAMYRRNQSVRRPSGHYFQESGPCIDTDLMYEKKMYQRKHGARFKNGSCASPPLSLYEELLGIDDMITLSRGDFVRVLVSRPVKAVQSSASKLLRRETHL